MTWSPDELATITTSHIFMTRLSCPCCHCTRLNTNYQLKLNLFAQQQPSTTTGRRAVLDPYTGLLGAQWARQFAEALMQPPDDPYWARIRWEYLQVMPGAVDPLLMAARCCCRSRAENSGKNNSNSLKLGGTGWLVTDRLI